MLRRWIAEYKPLRRVQDELDRVEPVADNLYKASLGLYRTGQLEATLPVLRQAISLNPNHVGTNQLLAEILLAQGQAGNAREILVRAVVQISTSGGTSSVDSSFVGVGTI
ncbi:MAG: tetratricopeptide repeat protein [Pseudomonadota bacterium]